MKHLILLKLAALTLLTSSFAFAGKPNDPRDNQVNYQNCRNQKRAVVVGASVTLGFFGDSPSNLYLRRSGFSERCILKKSFPISDSENLLGWVKKSVNDFKPDVIVAIDYLIHDVTFTRADENVEVRIQKTSESIDYLQSLNIPVVIGSVFTSRPDKHPFQVDLARRINHRLCEASNAKPNQFFVLPTSQMYREIYSDAFKLPATVRIGSTENFEVQEEIVPASQVMTDYYHPGPRGAHMMANRMMHYLNALHNSSRAYPFEGTLYTRDKIFSKDKNNDYILALFNAIEEDDKYSMKFVNSETIPESMGAESCTSMP